MCWAVIWVLISQNTRVCWLTRTLIFVVTTHWIFLINDIAEIFDVLLRFRIIFLWQFLFGFCWINFKQLWWIWEQSLNRIWKPIRYLSIFQNLYSFSTNNIHIGLIQNMIHLLDTWYWCRVVRWYRSSGYLCCLLFGRYHPLFFKIMNLICRFQRPLRALWRLFTYL